MWALWWAWLAAALVLGILEMVIPGFVLLGFAIGAAAVGILLAMGVNTTLPWLLVIFAGVSLVSWGFLRTAIGVRHGQKKIIDRDINED